jgi:hypothetical protein
MVARRDIALDIRRTDSTMTEQEAEQIASILYAFALVHPRIGYCQVRDIGASLGSRLEHDKGKRALEGCSKGGRIVVLCFEQAMNFVALCLLRVCQSEERAFFILCSLSRNILPYYYIKSMKVGNEPPTSTFVRPAWVWVSESSSSPVQGVRADMLVTYNLFKRRLPCTLEHFETLGLPLELFVTEWLLCIFR